MRPLLYLLCLVPLAFTDFASAEPSVGNLGPLLETEITWTPVEPDASLPQYQPGAEMILTAAVRNVGTDVNAPGSIYIEFSFKDQGLQSQTSSVLFQSESQDLPSITPGQTVTITFDRHHRWPSIIDFVRHDWLFRAYKSFISIRGRKSITGTAAISFQAHFVDGVKQPTPERFDAVEEMRLQEPHLKQLAPKRIHPQ